MSRAFVVLLGLVVASLLGAGIAIITQAFAAGGRQSGSPGAIFLAAFLISCVICAMVISWWRSLPR